MKLHGKPRLFRLTQAALLYFINFGSDFLYFSLHFHGLYLAVDSLLGKRIEDGFYYNSKGNNGEAGISTGDNINQKGQKIYYWPI